MLAGAMMYLLRAPATLPIITSHFAPCTLDRCLCALCVVEVSRAWNPYQLLEQMIVQPVEEVLIAVNIAHCLVNVRKTSAKHCCALQHTQLVRMQIQSRAEHAGGMGFTWD